MNLIKGITVQFGDITRINFILCYAPFLLKDMRNLGYRRQTSIVLSNEDYTNAGLKQEDMMEAIEKIDGVWMVEKYCINSNIVVHIKSNNPEYAKEVVFDIKMTLEDMLNGA